MRDVADALFRLYTVLAIAALYTWKSHCYGASRIDRSSLGLLEAVSAFLKWGPGF